MHFVVVALNKMSSFVGEDKMMKRSTNHIKKLILVRIEQEKHTQQIRRDSGLSRYYTIANGMGSNGLPLSCERDGSRKPSPLRNVINASDIIPPSQQQLRPSLQFMQSMQSIPFIPSMQFYMNFT